MYIYTTMKRKYNVNDVYFNKIDTEEKAYWLGFLLADGCIHERDGQDRLSLVLGIKDKNHLEKFKKSLSFEGPIIDYTKKSGLFIGLIHSYIRITSQLLVNDLAKVGCMPRKTLTLEFPIIYDELRHHFIRGYFDGDGNFQSDANHHQIRCCSRSKQLINDLGLILNYFDIVGYFKTENKNGAELYHLNIPSKYAKVYQEKIGTEIHKNKLLNIVAFIERTNPTFVSEQIDKICGFGEIIAYCGKTLKLPGQSRTYGFWKNKDSIGRRTMEKYMTTCRLILCCNSTSRVIPAVRSRCLCLRVPAPTHEQISFILKQTCMRSKNHKI